MFRRGKRLRPRERVLRGLDMLSERYLIFSPPEAGPGFIHSGRARYLHLDMLSERHFICLTSATRFSMICPQGYGELDEVQAILSR